MTIDLVEQLRQQKQIAPDLAIGHFRVVANPLCEQAATEIERLGRLFQRAHIGQQHRAYLTRYMVQRA